MGLNQSSVTSIIDIIRIVNQIVNNRDLFIIQITIWNFPIRFWIKKNVTTTTSGGAHQTQGLVNQTLLSNSPLSMCRSSPLSRSLLLSYWPSLLPYEQRGTWCSALSRENPKRQVHLTIRNRLFSFRKAAVQSYWIKERPHVINYLSSLIIIPNLLHSLNRRQWQWEETLSM